MRIRNRPGKRIHPLLAVGEETPVRRLREQPLLDRLRKGDPWLRDRLRRLHEGLSEATDAEPTVVHPARCRGETQDRGVLAAKLLDDPRVRWSLGASRVWIPVVALVGDDRRCSALELRELDGPAHDEVGRRIDAARLSQPVEVSVHAPLDPLVRS